MSSNLIKFKFEDFEGIYNEFNNIINILEDNAAEYKIIQAECENLKGVSFQIFSNNIEKCIEENQKIIDEISDWQIKFENIKDIANNHYKPISTNKIVKLDPEILRLSIKRVTEMLSIQELNSKIAESTSTSQWISSRHSELDDSYLEALFNPIDEIRQRRAENVFRSNEKLYKKAIESMHEELKFIEELTELEKYNNKIENLFDIYSAINKGDKLGALKLILGKSSDDCKKINISDYVNTQNIILSNLNFKTYYDGLFELVAQFEWEKLGNLLIELGIPLEKILKSTEPLGVVDVILAIIHLIYMFMGKTSGYETGKDLMGDLGSIIGGWSLEAISLAIGGISGAGAGAAAGAGVGAIPGSVVGGVTGVVIGNAVGSIGGEMLFEGIYEIAVEEDDDGTIHWIWED